MKVSREQMVQNKARILTEAARLFRERGFEGVSVADVMKAAGLTHGGFYGHFASKDDLIAQTVANALPSGGQADVELGAFLDAYLSPAHRDDAGAGCPTAAFASDLRRQSPEARAAMSAGLCAQLARLEAALPQMDPASRRRTATGIWSAMLGAMIMSRAIDDTALSDKILDETRDWIESVTGISGARD